MGSVDIYLVGVPPFLNLSFSSTMTPPSIPPPPHRIDLHGHTREEALQKLDSSLPLWLEDAMQEAPWTLPVDITSGGGNQAIAETVENWVCENRKVAKRFRA